jgi:uroporphyrinogen-III decarboxylase
MLAAVARQPVDRVPVATYNFHPFGSRHADDASYAALLVQTLDCAGMLCKTGAATAPAAGAGSRWGHVASDVECSAERTVTRQRMATPKGDLTSVVIEPVGQPALVTEHFIKDDADIDRYMSLPYVPKTYDTSAMQALAAQLAGRGLLSVGYGDAMYAAAALFDFNEFAIRCHTDIAPIRRLVDFTFERVYEDVRGLAAACADLPALFYTAGPELCTPPMVSPAVFAELVTPYQEQLIAVIHAAGLPAAIHCHGRVRSVLPEILRTGADMLEPIEPPPQGDMALAELRAAVGDRLCLAGHIQDQEFHTAAPGTMTRHVEDIARVIDGGTGYIMTPTCTPFQYPASDTFRRNYAEWLEAADRLL